jgi:hypothetical protein
MQTVANDTYLKVNNIEKGVKNYEQVVELVMRWYYNSQFIDKNPETESKGR